MSARFRHQDAKTRRFFPIPTPRNLPRGPIGTANPRGYRGGSRFRISRNPAETAKTARGVPRGKHHVTASSASALVRFGLATCQ